MVLDLKAMPAMNDGPLSHTELNMWAIPPRGRLNIPIADPATYPKVAAILQHIAIKMLEVSRMRERDALSKAKTMHMVIRLGDQELSTYTIGRAVDGK